MGQPVFVLNYHLYVEHLTRETIYQFQIFGLTRLGIEPRTSETQKECSTTAGQVYVMKILCQSFNAHYGLYVSIMLFMASISGSSG